MVTRLNVQGLTDKYQRWSQPVRVCACVCGGEGGKGGSWRMGYCTPNDLVVLAKLYQETGRLYQRNVAISEACTSLLCLTATRQRHRLDTLCNQSPDITKRANRSHGRRIVRAHRRRDGTGKLRLMKDLADVICGGNVLAYAISRRSV